MSARPQEPAPNKVSTLETRGFIDEYGSACVWVPLEDCEFHWMTTVDAYLELQQAYGPGLRFRRCRPGRRGWFIYPERDDGAFLPAVVHFIGKATNKEQACCWNNNAFDLRPVNIEVRKRGTKRGVPPPGLEPKKSRPRR